MSSVLKKIDVTTVAIVDGKEVRTTAAKIDRFRIEFWSAVNYAEIEAKAFCYPSLMGPARGALPQQEVSTGIKFTPSAALRAAILAEIKTAVDAEVAR